MAHTEHVLIVGGGFGGVKAALELADDPHFTVSLLSDSDSLRYYPTLYHTATGGARANSSIPLQRIFAEKPVELLQGSAETLDRKAKTITTTDGVVHSYDTLILALGVVTNYFGIPGMQDYAYSIKTQDEVARFKHHLHQQLADDKKPDLHYVIVGGGPTGIELAGALPGYIKKLMKEQGIRDQSVHVDLIEASPRLLPRLPKQVSHTVKRRLKRLGVKLYTGSVVQATTPEELTVNGRAIRSHTVVWTAGVTNHPFFADNHFILMGRGKVAVDTYLQTEPDIYVIGDNANTPYSGLAQTALLDGSFVAWNLCRRAKGKQMRSYNAKAPITVVPAGPHWAVVVWGKVVLHGFVGYVLREAADFIGFQDLEPLNRATRQFLSEFQEEGDPHSTPTAQKQS